MTVLRYVDVAVFLNVYNINPGLIFCHIVLGHNVAQYESVSRFGVSVGRCTHCPRLVSFRLTMPEYVFSCSHLLIHVLPIPDSVSNQHHALLYVLKTSGFGVAMKVCPYLEPVLQQETKMMHMSHIT